MVESDLLEMPTVEQLRNRGSLKWTAAAPDELAAWVAEMDFGIAAPIERTLRKGIDDRFFGYPGPQLIQDSIDAAAGYQRTAFGWDVDPRCAVVLADVIQGLELTINRLTPAGSPVVIPTPAYRPFTNAAIRFDRERRYVPMLRADDASYSFDFAGIEDEFRSGAQLLILANPLNPLGRVNSRAELERLAAIVDEYGGRVFADEIHAPLTHDLSEHVPYASINEIAAGHTITAVSASKSWNLAGLKNAHMFLTNPGDFARYAEAPTVPANHAGNFGLLATVAAFRESAAWNEQVREYLRSNLSYASARIEAEIPGALAPAGRASYLLWVEATMYREAQPIADTIREQGKVLVQDHRDFATTTTGAFRLNVATPRPILEKIIDGVVAALA